MQVRNCRRLSSGCLVELPTRIECDPHHPPVWLPIKPKRRMRAPSQHLAKAHLSEARGCVVQSSTASLLAGWEDVPWTASEDLTSF